MATSAIARLVLVLVLCGALQAQDPPVVSALASTPRPAATGALVTFSATASDPDGDVLAYVWRFGDGSLATSASASPQATHAFAAPGHYTVTCQVSDGVIMRARTIIQTVCDPVTATPPSSSATIVFDAARGRVWTVNPDSDTVTAIDAATLVKVLEVPVGRDPRTLALAPDGTVWVACQRDSELRVLAGADGSAVATIALPYGWGPIGIVMAPDGGACYVTASAAGNLLRYDPVTRARTGTLALGPTPRAIAVSGDSSRILVTRFISPADHGEVWEVAAPAFTRTRTHVLAFDSGEGGDNATAGRGVPNYLMHVAITPDGRQAWVGSKKDNTARGLMRDGRPLGFDSTVRSIVSRIDLQTNTELLSLRRDNDDREITSAICFTPLGDFAFVAFQGNNRVDVIDRFGNALFASALDAGSIAPQGVCLDPQGSRLYVQGFLSRSITAYDVGAVTRAEAPVAAVIGTTATVATELLAPQVLAGKRVFYNAADLRMGSSGYISCATCHLDGGHDGRVFDFTDRGEGFRNTTTLQGRRGTGHGRVHWTGNFDEIQDFEQAMRNDFRGNGFISDAALAIGTRRESLGDPKAGLSPELDAMAAYVASLNRIPASPNRSSSGGLTAPGATGRAIFRRLDCQACHGGADFTDSASGRLHDVGTLKPTSGQRMGAALAGIDTPTLLGLADTAPYLHDGSAATIDDVFAQAAPGSAHGLVQDLDAAERSALNAFLEQIDGSEPAAQPADRAIAVTVTRDGAPLPVVMSLSPEHATTDLTPSPTRTYTALSSDVTYTVSFAPGASALAVAGTCDPSWSALPILALAMALSGCALAGGPRRLRRRAVAVLLGCLMTMSAMTGCGAPDGNDGVLASSLTLSGSLTDAGAPVGAAAVAVVDATGRIIAADSTLADGSFRFAALVDRISDVRLIVRRR